MSDPDVLDERFLKAEGQLLRDNYREKPKIRWLKAPCSFCGYVVVYSPKEDFQGDLRCPHCGKMFHLTRLDDFKRGK